MLTQLHFHPADSSPPDLYSHTALSSSTTHSVSDESLQSADRQQDLYYEPYLYHQTNRSSGSAPLLLLASIVLLGTVGFLIGTGNGNLAPRLYSSATKGSEAALPPPIATPVVAVVNQSNRAVPTYADAPGLVFRLAINTWLDVQQFHWSSTWYLFLASRDVFQVALEEGLAQLACLDVCHWLAHWTSSNHRCRRLLSSNRQDSLCSHPVRNKGHKGIDHGSGACKHDLTNPLETDIVRTADRLIFVEKLVAPKRRECDFSTDGALPAEDNKKCRHRDSSALLLFSDTINNNNNNDNNNRPCHHFHQNLFHNKQAAERESACDGPLTTLACTGSFSPCTKAGYAHWFPRRNTIRMIGVCMVCGMRLLYRLGLVQSVLQMLDNSHQCSPEHTVVHGSRRRSSLPRGSNSIGRRGRFSNTFRTRTSWSRPRSHRVGMNRTHASRVVKAFRSSQLLLLPPIGRTLPQSLQEFPGLSCAGDLLKKTEDRAGAAALLACTKWSRGKQQHRTLRSSHSQQLSILPPPPSTLSRAPGDSRAKAATATATAAAEMMASFIESCSSLSQSIVDDASIVGVAAIGAQESSTATQEDKHFDRRQSSAPQYSQEMPSTSLQHRSKGRVRRTLSINSYLPPEVLVVIFSFLPRSRQLACMLVCHGWYQLLGPIVWKSPRILWSRHWPRFSQASPPGFSKRRALISIASSTTTAPATRLMSSSLPSSTNRTHDSETQRSRRMRRQSLDDQPPPQDTYHHHPTGLDIVSSSKQRLMSRIQTFHQDHIQVERLSEADQQEYAEWLEWKRKERSKARERKRRREEIKKQHRQLVSLAQRQQARIDALSYQLAQINKRNDEDREDGSFADYFWSDDDTSNAENERVIHEVTQEVQRREAALDNIQSELAQLDRLGMGHTQDDLEEDNYLEHDNSDDTAYDSAEDESPLMILMNGFDFLHSFIKPALPCESHGANPSSQPRSTLSEEDEQGESKDQDALDSGSGGVSGSETDMEEADPDVVSLSLANQFPRSRSSSASSNASSLSLSEMSPRPFAFPFAGTLERLRKKQRARERRQRLSELCPLDGLPQALPLVTCGHWIKVINLQQDTPFRHHTSLQHLYPQQHLEPRWRASRMVDRPHGPALAHNGNHNNINGQEPPRRRSYLSFLFGHRPISDFDEEEVEDDHEGNPALHPAQQQQQHQQQQQQSTIPFRQQSLFDMDFDLVGSETNHLTRHDFVSDHTLQIILEHCPNLARLTLSECTRITDRGLEMIRDSECVAREQLVSLHMAGCWRITDRGLASLVDLVPAASTTTTTTTTTVSDTTNGGESATATATTTAEQQCNDAVHLKLESLDIAGCWQVTDRGLIPVLRACGTNLTQLRASNCELVTGASVAELAKHCPKMRWLDLARTGKLQDSAVQALAANCRQLEWLNLARVHPGETYLSPIQQEQQHGFTPSLQVQGQQGQQQPMAPASRGSSFSADKTGNNASSDVNSQSDEISDATIGQLCEACPQLQLLDVSYIPSLTNESMELLSQHAESLVCLTIIGCSGITAQALYALARLRNASGRLSCITMGDALGISESDIEKIMQGTLSGWQKSSVEETSMSDILGGLSWQDD